MMTSDRQEQQKMYDSGCQALVWQCQPIIFPAAFDSGELKVGFREMYISFAISAQNVAEKLYFESVDYFYYCPKH